MDTMIGRSSASLLTRPAAELAGLVRNGDISPPGLVAAALARVEERRELNAFIFIGRVNAPEFGIVPVIEPRLFGPTRNPWNTESPARRLAATCK